MRNVTTKMTNMTKPIQQSVKFNASPKALCEMLMDSKKHSAATGGAARISRRADGNSAPGTACSRPEPAARPEPPDRAGLALLQFPIVGSGLHPRPLLQQEGSGTRVHMVHVNVPAEDHSGVSQGWPKFYWQPWKKYLANSEQDRVGTR
jgi:hypothetical protein